MIFVDTGFFLAVSQPRDALHARATAWAQAVTGPLLVTEYVLRETVNGLSKSVDRPRAHLLLRQVRSGVGWSIVPASAELFEAGMQLHAERADAAFTPLGREMHPPVDRTLLQNLAAEPRIESLHKTAWRTISWTRLTQVGYYELIEQLRAVLPAGAPLWMLEEFWSPTEAEEGTA